MEDFASLLSQIKDWVWSPPLLILLLGTGIYLTIILKGMQFSYLFYAFKETIRPSASGSSGDISAFQALMTSLAGAIGTGSIVGVVTAVTVGGLGALFWMWVVALISMATKYAESLLAVKFRVLDKRGEMMGGPMQYMEFGLGWKKIALVFGVFGSLAAIGTGNLVQVNAITEAVSSIAPINPWYSGITLAFLIAIVVIGGVKSIGRVSSILVPMMALFYLFAGLIILCMHLNQLPEAFSLIISSAFRGQAAVGGFMGATIAMAVQMGVSRSIFSNEAGLGISSIAAAAAKTDSPPKQALITMTGALLSTVVVCTITGLILAVTGVFGMQNEDGSVVGGATLAIQAFNTTLPGGSYIVAVGLMLFAFSTVIAWAYYGEKCCEYVFGERSVILYRILFSLIAIPGAAIKLEVVWYVADILNGIMVIPNLFALIALSKVITSETEIFLNKLRKENNKLTNIA